MRRGQDSKFNMKESLEIFFEVSQKRGLFRLEGEQIKLRP